MPLLLPFLALTALLNADPVCPRCEQIRDERIAHPEQVPYYYEDYLQEQPPDIPDTKNPK